MYANILSVRPHPVRAWRSTRHVHPNSNLGDSRRGTRRTVYVMGYRTLFIASLVEPSNSIKRLGFPGTNVRHESSRSVTIAATIKTTTSTNAPEAMRRIRNQEGIFQLVSTMRVARANKLYIVRPVFLRPFFISLFPLRSQIVEYGLKIRG